MLEKQLSVILAKYLNKFICDLHEEQLRISLWSGDLVLRNLELRANILDEIFLSLFEVRQQGDGVRAEGVDPSEAAAKALLMPFTVVRGVVRELVISVPWSALDREPVSVEVRGVDIVLGPLRRRPYNAEEDALRVQMVKQKQLRMFEAERLGNNVATTGIGSKSENGIPDSVHPESNSKSRSYTEQVMETIARNVHVVLYDVSIRYVLDYVGLHPQFTSELIISFKEVYVTTTDDETEDRFIVDLSMPYCKKIVISDLDISVCAFKQENPDQQKQKDPEAPAGYTPPQEWGKAMTIVSIPDLTLCLRLPGAGNARFVLRALVSSPARLRASFGAAGALALILDSLQYGLVGVQYRQHLHLLTAPEGNLARRRWSFAICCALEDVRRAYNKNCSGRQCFSGDVVSFGERRRTYCALWKRTQGVSWLPGLTAAERATLDALEEALTLEQIILFRSLAYAALGEERHLQAQQREYISAAERRSAAASATGGGWWSRWFGPRQAASAPTHRVAEWPADSSVTEWERGTRFLQRIACGQSVGAPGVSVVVTVAAVEVILELHPAVWHREVAQSHPMLNFLERSGQYVEARITSLRVTHGAEPTPRENFVGLHVRIGKSSAAFCGEVSVPLLDSLHDHTDQRDLKDDVVTGDMSEGWFSLSANETRTMFNASLGRTCVTLHPLCEPCWWLAAMQDFVAALPRYTARFPHHTCTNTSLSPSESMRSKKIPPSFELNVAGVDLVVPLSTSSSRLLLRLPSLCFGTAADCGATHCRLSVIGDAPLRLCCETSSEESVHILQLADVVVDMAHGGDVTVRVCVELTVDPRALAAINAYLASLSVAQNARARLMCLYAQAQGVLHARSTGTASLHSQERNQSMRVALHAKFARVLVRNASGDDIVDMELRGNADDGAAPALLLEAPPAADADCSLLLRVPDLCVVAPTGRQLFALDTICLRVGRAGVNVSAGSLRIVLCDPIVECVEILLGAAASLRRPQVTGNEKKEKVPPPTSEVLETGRLTNVSLSHVHVRLAGYGNAMVTAQGSQAKVCIDDRSRSTEAQLTLDLLEHALVDDDTGEDVECFRLLGPNTGSGDVAMTVRVTVEAKSTGTHVRSVLEGGRIGYFHNRWMELSTLYKWPSVARCLAIPTLGTSRRGFLLCEGESMEAEAASCSEITRTECNPRDAPRFTFEAEVLTLEILLATDARREIDMASSDSYCHFSMERMAIRAESHMGSHWRVDTKVRGVHYHGEHNDTLLPFIALADIRVENCIRVVSKADRSGYDFSEHATARDVAVFVTVRDSEETNKGTDKDIPNKANVSNSAYSSKPGAALDAQLTKSALGLLLTALSFNLMRPAPSPTRSADPPISHASQCATPGHTSMLITLDSVRVLLIGEEQHDAFALRGAAQFFASHGGAAAGWAVHLRSVTVDDISPSRSVVSRDVPRWKAQKQQLKREVSYGCKKRLVSLDSAAVFVFDETMECVVNDLIVTAASRLWTTLYSALCSSTTSTALAEMKGRRGGSSINSNNNNNSDSLEGQHTSDASKQEIIVRLCDCRVLLEEAWEEPLATLTLRAVDVKLRDSCRVARLRVNAPITLEPCDGGPSMFQWDSLKECRTDSNDVPIDVAVDEVVGDHHNSHDDDDDDENNSTDFPTEVNNEGEVENDFVRVDYVTGSVTQMHTFDTPNAIRPQFALSGRLCVFVQGIRLVVDVAFARRLLAYAGAEAVVYSSLFAQRPAAPLTNVLGLQVRVRDAALHLQPSEFRLAIEACSVVNAYAEAPESTAPSGLGCAAHTHTLRARGMQLLHTRLHAVALPELFLRVTMPITSSVFAESRAALSIGADDSTAFRCTYTFLSPPPPLSAFCRHVRAQTAAGARVVVFSALHAREVLRAYHDVSDHAGRHALPTFYDTSPRTADKQSAMRTSFALDLPHVLLRVAELPQTSTGAVFAELRVCGRVTGQIAHAADSAHARAHMAFGGVFELLDGQGVALLYRRASAVRDSEAQTQSVRGDEDMDTALEVVCVETVEERRVFVESRGITVSLHPHAVDFVLRLQNLFALIMSDTTMDNDDNNSSSNMRNEKMKSGIIECNKSNDIVDGEDSDALVQKAAKRTLLSIRLATVVAALEDKALLEARGFEARFEREPVRLQWDIVNEQPYSFRIADIVLQEQDGERAFVRIGGVEVALGVGQVNVRARSVIVNNYDIIFYMDVFDSVRALHGYVVQNIKFSKNKEEGFKQSIIISLSDVCVCFFLSRRKGPSAVTATRSSTTTKEKSSSKGVSDFCAVSLGQEPSGVEIAFPAIVVKQVVSTTTRSISFETENGIFSYRRPEGRLPPFMKNVSFTCLITENIVAQSHTTTLNLSSLEAFVPVGHTLQCSVEAVAQALLPLLYATVTDKTTHVEDDDVGADLRDGNEDRGRPVAPAGRTPRDEHISFTLPLVSLNVCCAHSDEAALVEPPTVLFGVSVHNVYYEHSHNGTNERTLAQALSITSNIDPHIQDEFFSATAPCGAIDDPSKWALYFCKEATSDANSHGNTILGENNNKSEAEAVQMPARRMTVVARVHAFRLTVSPELLSILNEHVLRHVASAMEGTWQNYASWVSSRTILCDFNSTRSYNSSSGETGDRLLSISSDFCFSADLVLGGHRGSRIHFLKEPINTAPLNRVTIRTINHARIFVSMFENPDGTTEPPIVVDPGLTVVFEGVPVFLERGKLADYAVLGPRALIITSDAHMKIVPSNPEPLSLPLLRPALGCNVSARWYTQHVNFDVSADVVMRLSSHHQTLTMVAEASARYRIEKQCYEGNRGVRDFVDEGGKLALSNVSIFFDGGAITPEPTGFVVHIKHTKGGDSSSSGTTIVRALIPQTHFTLSIEHLRLLCAMATQIRCSLNHFVTAKAMSLTHARKAMSENVNFSMTAMSNSSTTTTRASTSSIAHRTSLVWSRDGDPAPTVDFGLSGGTVSVILTNDFCRPEVLLELNSIALHARGSRSLSRLTSTGQVNVRVADYPHAQPPRDLIVFAPELALEYIRYPSDGYSLHSAITCEEATLTLPVETALRLLQFRTALQGNRPYSFRNSTGVDLLITAAGPVQHAVQSFGHLNQQSSRPSCGKGTATRLSPNGLLHTNALRNDTACFRISAESNSVGQWSTANSAVDLSILHRGATCRVPLGHSALGVLDGVVRLDKAQRIIDVTTCVAFVNGLATHDVCLPAGLTDPFIVRPGETRYVTLPALRRTFSVAIGAWRSTVRNAVVTLEMLVAAFALLPSQGIRPGTGARAVLPTCSHREDDDTLVIPLKLCRENADEVEAVVQLVLTRRLAVETARRSSLLLPKYEVQLRLSPFLAIANETGATLAVSVGDSAERLLPYGQAEQDWLTPFPSGAALSVALVIGDSGVRLTGATPLSIDFAGSSTTLELSGVTDGALVIVRTEHGRLAVRAAAVLHNALPFAVYVGNAKGLPLTAQPKDGVAPGSQLPILHDIHNPGATLRVRAGGPGVKFSMPFACRAPSLSGMLLSTGETVARFFRVRRVGGERAATVPEARLEPIWHFRNRACVFSLEVRAVSSQIDASYIQGTTFTSNNNNDNNRSGLNDGYAARLIHPLTEMEWTDFAASMERDPCVQVRFCGSAGFFVWSDPIRLSVLSSSNVPVVKKHFMPDSGAGSFAKAGVAGFPCTRVPHLLKTQPTTEYFACLSVTPSQQDGQFVVDFALDTSVPLVLENRTARMLQFQELSQQYSVRGARDGVLCAYLVEPFTDCATCLDGENADPVLDLTLFDEHMNAVRCVVDLAKSASTREAVRASEDMYVLCTYNYSLQRYYVSVTTDRLIETSLVFQPRYILHFETFVRSLTLHVASLCVPKKETSLLNTPLGKLALRNELCLGDLTDSDSTESEKLSALQSRELDVVLLHVIGLCGEFSLNEKHYLGRIDVGRMAVADCTNPRPVHPLVVELQSTGKTEAVRGNPALSLKFHALASSGDVTPDGVRCNGSRTVTIPFETISLNMIPITVKLSDSFLFILLQSYECILEAKREYEGGSSRTKVDDISDSTAMSSPAPGESPEPGVIPGESRENKEEQHQYQKQKPSHCNEEIKKWKDVRNEEGYNAVTTQEPSLVDGPVLYNCRIARLFVSHVELVLTLTRRADGRYDPFAGVMLGSRLIPSVEEAPLSIAEIERYDVNQRSSSPFGALTAVLYPPYKNQLLMQLYKIVGSLEILGNPIALVSGLRKGMRSFLAETVDMNPIKGARDLLLATASSTLHSVGLLSRVGGRTAAAISLDNEWLEDRGAAPDSGVLRGIAHGLRGGFEGVVSRPLDGARTSGIAGFCTGFATGAAGLVMRPVAGTLDGLGHTAEFLARRMREPDNVPNTQIEYVNSGRNFVAAEKQGRQLLKVDVGEVNASRITPQTAEMAPEPQEDPGRDYGEDFVSRAVYEQLLDQIDDQKLDGADAAQFIFKKIGLHNYALHAEWSEFVEYTTPEEFHNWLSIALTAAMSVRLEEITTLGTPGTNSSTIVTRSRKGGNVEHSAVERARNIKNALGVRDMLSYVSLEHFACVCSLNEVKSSVSPNDLKRKMPHHLLAGMKASLEWIVLQ